MCEEIPVGRRDAAAIPVQQRGRGDKCLIEDLWTGWRAVCWWLKVQNRNIPQASSLLVYREDPSDRSTNHMC